MSPVKVISQQPPGGRCTLYARYADAVGECLGWPHSVVPSEERDAHGDGFPSLWIRDVALQPEEVCKHLSGPGVEQAQPDSLLARLRGIHDTFINPMGQ